MATKAFKSEKIDAIKAKAEKAQVAILTEYKGYTVEEITNLRRNIQKDGGDYMVTKNTLAKIALKGTDFEVLADSLTGPVAIAFGFEVFNNFLCNCKLSCFVVLNRQFLNHFFGVSCSSRHCSHSTCQFACLRF